MIIALDVDCPCADVLAEVLRRYNADYDDHLTIESFKQWDLKTAVKKECGSAIYDYFRQPTFYEHVQPTEGSIEGVQALRSAGHEVLFVTSNMYEMTDEKAFWLLRHGFSDDHHTHMLPGDLIVARDKSRVHADILIDDNGAHVKRWVEETRRKAVLFERPWNRYLLDEVHSAFWSYCERAQNWRELLAIIARLESM